MENGKELRAFCRKGYLDRGSDGDRVLRRDFKDMWRSGAEVRVIGARGGRVGAEGRSRCVCWGDGERR